MVLNGVNARGDAAFYGRGGPGTIVGALEVLEPAQDDVTVSDPTGSIATIRRLSSAIANRNVTISRFEDYYRGRQGRRFIATKYRELFAKLFENYNENFCGVVVDALEERLDVVGFRFPVADAEPETTDTDAWRIWQDNGLDAQSQIAHTEALVKGIVYILVSPFASDRVGEGSPRITVEDPCGAIVELDPGTRERLVGMKRWVDPATTLVFVTLYFPDRVEKWRQTSRRWANQYSSGYSPTGSWEQRAVDGEPWPLENPLGVVPLIPMINRPRLDGSGESEIEKILSIQDAINTQAINELVASEAAAFPQKWATGIEIPIDPETKKPLEPWKPDMDRILSTIAKDAKFGQFDAADLSQYGDAIDRRVRRIASISSTPYHYFMQQSGQPPSGESLKSAETGLVRKAYRRQVQFGDPWEESLRLAFQSLDDPRGKASGAEAKWANPETLTEAEHIDALTKQRQALHVPLQVLWEEAGYSPARRAAFKKMLEEERTWLNSTPVQTTQPFATPAPDALPAAPPAPPSAPAPAGQATGGTSNG